MPTGPSDTRCTGGRWTESEGKAAVVERCGGRCENCGRPWDLDPAHRQRRSALGTWSPVNLLALCRSCHDWAHHKPLLAQGLGWEVLPEGDPATEAAWIHTPGRLGPGWHLLAVEYDAEGIRRHVVIPVEPRWVA